MPAHMLMEITVVLPAGKIPLGSTVTKRTGRKTYTLKDRLRVFSVPLTKAEKEAGAVRGEGQEVVAEPGVLFLVNEGDANAIPSSTELMWTTTAQYLTDWLRHGLDPYKDSGK